jgi:hypothetical protein
VVVPSLNVTLGAAVFASFGFRNAAQLACLMFVSVDASKQKWEQVR